MVGASLQSWPETPTQGSERLQPVKPATLRRRLHADPRTSMPFGIWLRGSPGVVPFARSERGVRAATREPPGKQRRPEPADLAELGGHPWAAGLEGDRDADR